MSGTVAAASAQVPRPGAPSQIDERLVQLGAFGSVDEAKRAWRAMERSYPPLKQFSASVIQNRDWNGHAFYQFQVGTASQADSEMLCQSLKHLNFRCAIVVPPWKS